jgi:nitrogen fixation protein NifZ
VRVGHHVEANVPVYLVEFPGGVIGCTEDEIVPA